jgi:hypothetical protein
VDRVLVLGDGCPAALIPPTTLEVTAGADLVLIAPSADQARERGWLEQTTGAAAQRLSRDGFVYVLVPRRARREARRRLRAAGLELGDAIVQLPGGAAPRHLVPLQAEPWRYALTEQIGSRPRARQALRAARALPGGAALLARALPSVGLVARHSGAKPLFDWVTGLDGERRPAAHAVVATSWRGPAGPIVMRCFAPAESQPWGVAKLGPDSAEEARALEQLGAGVQSAGARLPQLLASGRLGDRAVLVETVLGGRPAARVLMRSPTRFAELAGAIADWLERWNRETRQTAPSGRPLDTELLDLVSDLALPDDYGSWLAERSQALAAGQPPLVARHNDLTMWNVLVDGRGTIGVLDWAEAEPAGLPLTDFFYAIADAAAACDGYRDRLGAVRACFAPGGQRADLVAPLRARLRTSLGLTPEAAELCFHACWLHHARNERRSGEDGPFLEIARWLAHRPGEPA